MAFRWRAAAGLAAALTIVAGCDGRGGDPPDAAPRLALAADRSSIAVLGLPPADLARLKKHSLTPVEWSALLRVVVATERPVPPDMPAMLGTYGVDGGALRFIP